MSRIEGIINNKIYQDYLRQLTGLEKDRVFCHHDWEHLIAVSRISYILALEKEGVPHIAWEANGGTGEQADYQEREVRAQVKEIIYAAGLLHDIGRVRQYQTGEDHALIGGQLAEPILVDAGFNRQEIQLICQAIERHRQQKEHSSLLSEIISQADGLARQCNSCHVKSDCYKYEKMPTSILKLIY